MVYFEVLRKIESSKKCKTEYFYQHFFKPTQEVCSEFSRAHICAQQERGKDS